jgi:hypothetical protein
VLGLAFSPDGKSMLTLTWGDRTARLWGVASDTSVARPAQFRAFTNPEGQIWMDGSEIWNAPPGKMPAPLLGEPQRIALWITVVTGTELSEDGRGLRVLDAETWRKRREQLDALGGPLVGY